MKLVINGVLLLVVAGQFGNAVPQSADPKESTQDLCMLRGVLVDSITGKGLKKAYVRLTANGDAYPVVTDENGGFVFESVAPGTYRLDAEHQGYVDGELTDAFGEPVQVKLIAGQNLTDVNIKLTPQAVLSGRIVDEDGDPWTHAHVNLLHSVWQHGRKQVEGIESYEVNDQGEFRIGQISPGTYYLMAEPDSQWEKENTPRSKEPVLPHQATWLPGSLAFEGATPIVVGPANQLSGLEIRLHRGSMHRISGVLTGLDRIAPPDGSNPFGGRRIVAAPDFNATPKDGIIHPDGSFEIPDVPPGDYEIRVRQGYPSSNLGSAKVQVADRDVQNMSIQLTSPQPLKGAIQVDGESSIKASGLRIVLDSESSPSLSAISKADGTFEFPPVGLSQYRVIVGGKPGSEFYLKQIQFGGVVSNDGTISLPGAGGSLVLMLGAHGARLTGRLNRTLSPGRDAAAEPQVVLTPADGKGEVRLAVFDQTGAFTFEDPLPPGTYKVYAFDGAPDGAWEDPDFMKEVSGSGVEVKLAEGEFKSVDIAILPRSELAPTLKKLGME